MAQVIHKVVWGDTLSEIAVRYGVTVEQLQKLNNITNPDKIIVGQELIITGEAAKKETNTTSVAKVNLFGLQSNTDRTMYATWTWDKTNTENYQVKWYYDTGDGVWFVGNDSKVTEKQSTYTAPANAKKVKFTVKPISKNKSTNGASSSHWEAGWSTAKTYSFSSNPPVTPSTPSVKIEKYTLTVELTNLTKEINATHIQFQIVKDDTSVYKTGNAAIKTESASYSCTVAAGGKYKVRCRSYKGTTYSEWSGYSSNVETMPAASAGITTIRASSKTSIYLEWKAAGAAKTYDIEYATKKEYFDNTNQTNTVSSIEFTHYELIGLETGYEYFFRVRAVNNSGASAWSGIKSVIIGRDPGPPTTWSSSTTVVVGEPLNLYWMHNSEDGSSQTYADLEVYVDGVKELIEPIKNSTDEEEKDKTSVYSIDTSQYREGVKIEWRVRTAGVTLTYGDWSVQRTVDIYAPPTLQLNVTNQNGTEIDILERFPMRISALAGPNTQVPVGYYLTVTSNDSYETIDRIGNAKIVSPGDKVYSKFFDISDPLLVELSAHNIDLENNISYKVSCLVSMNSGLTVEDSREFTVAWSDIEYEPNAEIGIDKDTLSAFIRPYCDDVDGKPIEDVTLSVYRREFDGRFTELATGIDNLSNTYITDPHPSLDYARYRIVAISKTNGDVSYCDLPGHPVGGKSVVIQWDEVWSNFDVSNEDAMEQRPWSGSMLKLPYNIKVSDSNKPDVSLVSYIGRENPVSYYGTQRGETSNWSVAIDKEDKETLYALRRLMNWMGDVYVREPSGRGHWAHVTVSYGHQFDDLIIPVTLNITRVEGGV